MYIPNILAEIEQEHDVELDPSDTKGAYIKAYIDTFTETGAQGAYHIYENGFDGGDATVDDFEADAKRLGVHSTGLVLGALDAVFERLYRDALTELAVGCIEG